MSDIITKIDWIPDFTTYILSISKPEFKKISLPLELKKFLNDECSRGNIIYQELVSMIPGILAPIEQDSLVLDLCASPGSKTLQILEKMLVENIKFTNSYNKIPGISYSNNLL